MHDCIDLNVKQLIEELSSLDDFGLNDIIDFGLNDEKNIILSDDALSSWVVKEGLKLWQKRHPVTLPPCFLSISPARFLVGTQIIYEWPRA